MPTTIGIYLGTATESVQNIEKQLLAWLSLLDGYNLELFGSATPPSTVAGDFRYVRTEERSPKNALVKQAVTYRDASEYVSRSEPHVLVQLWNFPGHAPGISLAGRRHGIPVVTRFSGDHYREFDYFTGLERLLYYAYLNLIGRIPLLLSDAIIALGPHGAAQLRSKGANNGDIHLLPPATGLEKRFHPSADPSRHRQDLDIPLGKTVLLYVGRLSGLKGMEFLQDVVELLENTGEHLFVLVGNGEYRDKFHDQFESDVVRTPGYVDYSLVDRYYKAADVYVHCSPYEGIPAVVLEALQCNLPVVSRRAGDIEFVTPNIVDTPAEMAAMIRNSNWTSEWRNRDQFESEHQQQVLRGMIDALL